MKSHLKQIIAVSIAAVSICAISPVKANAQWKYDNVGYYFEDGGNYYTGWKEIDGKWYYFYKSGYMAHNTVIDGYYVDSSGKWNSFLKDRMIGTWLGLNIDSTKTGDITSDTILGCKYEILEDTGDYVVVNVYNNHNEKRKYKFVSYIDDTMMMYWYDEETNNYVGGTLLLREGKLEA